MGRPTEMQWLSRCAAKRRLRDKDVRARLAEMSLDIAGGPPAKVTELIRSDAAKWKKVIDEAGIKVD